VNRLFPEGSDGFFKDKLLEQQKYMDVINESFNPLTILKAYQLPLELVGISSLEKLGDMVFGDIDPVVHFSTEKPMDIYSENGMDIISLRLPFTMKDAVNLYMTGDNLLVEVGPYRRQISLPTTFTRKAPDRAEFKEGRLLIMFRSDDHGRRKTK
jgi:arsenite-transporting ATPase